MKKVIVIGSGYSGSGAIFDYLVKRSDICDPFQGGEMRLIQDPDGLMDLYVSCSQNFSLQGTSAAFNRFLAYCARTIRVGMGASPGLRESIDRFVRDTTAVEYGAAPYCERLKMNWAYRFFFEYHEKWSRMRGRKPELVRVRVPVGEEMLVAKAQEMLDRIIVSRLRGVEPEVCAINHGGSFWNPVSSTIFYRDRKVVIVQRDARDIYAETSQYGRAYPGRDPALFCSWFRAIMAKINLDEWKHPDVLVLSFEEFVRCHADSVAVLAGHIGLAKDLTSGYDPGKSAGNIGKFKNILSTTERTLIEKELKEYCYL